MVSTGGGSGSTSGGDPDNVSIPLPATDVDPEAFSIRLSSAMVADPALLHEMKLLNSSIQAMTNSTSASTAELLRLNTSIQGLANSIQGLNGMVEAKLEELNVAVQAVGERLEWFNPNPQADLTDSDYPKVTLNLGKEKDKLKEKYAQKKALAESAMSGHRTLIAQVLVILTSLSAATQSTNLMAARLVVYLFLPVIVSVKLSFYMAVYLCYAKLRAVGPEFQEVLVERNKFNAKVDEFCDIIGGTETGPSRGIEAPAPPVAHETDEMKAKLESFKKEVGSFMNVTVYNFIELVLTTLLSMMQAAVLIVTIITSHHNGEIAAAAPSPHPT